MTVLVEMSAEVEKLLAAEWGDLGKAAREALVIESYRQGKLSLGQCGAALGLCLADVEAFLRGRGVDLDLTLQDVQRDRDALRRVLK
jgi:predicted HTH domain antitoxin